MVRIEDLPQVDDNGNPLDKSISEKIKTSPIEKLSQGVNNNIGKVMAKGSIPTVLNDQQKKIASTPINPTQPIKTEKNILQTKSPKPIEDMAREADSFMKGVISLAGKNVEMLPYLAQSTVKGFKDLPKNVADQIVDTTLSVMPKFGLSPMQQANKEGGKASSEATVKYTSGKISAPKKGTFSISQKDIDAINQGIKDKIYDSDPDRKAISFIKFFGGILYPAMQAIETEAKLSQGYDIKRLAEETGQNIAMMSAFEGLGSMLHIGHTPTGKAMVWQPTKEIRDVMKEFPNVPPQDIIDVWNDAYGQQMNKNPELYKYISGLTNSEKSQLIKESLKNRLKQVVDPVDQSIATPKQENPPTVQAPKPSTQEKPQESIRLQPSTDKNISPIRQSIPDIKVQEEQILKSAVSAEQELTQAMATGDPDKIQSATAKLKSLADKHEKILEEKAQGQQKPIANVDNDTSTTTQPVSTPPKTPVQSSDQQIQEPVDTEIQPDITGTNQTAVQKDAKLYRKDAPSFVNESYTGDDGIKREIFTLRSNNMNIGMVRKAVGGKNIGKYLARYNSEKSPLNKRVFETVEDAKAFVYKMAKINSPAAFGNKRIVLTKKGYYDSHYGIVNGEKIRVSGHPSATRGTESSYGYEKGYLGNLGDYKNETINGVDFYHKNNYMDIVIPKTNKIVSDFRKIEDYVRNKIEEYTGKKLPKTIEGTKKVISGEGQASKGKITIDSAEITPSKKSSKEDRLVLSNRVAALVKKYAERFGENYNPKGSLGVFFPKSKNIFLISKNEISTAVHEVTHFLDQKLGIKEKICTKGNVEMKENLTNVYVEHYPGGRKNHKLATRLTEGLAKFFERYIMAPLETKAEFPYLYNNLIVEGGAYYEPLMKDFIKDAREIINDYQSLDPLSKIGARVVDLHNPNTTPFLTKFERYGVYLVDDKYPAEKLDKNLSNIVRMYDYVPKMMKHNLSDAPFVGVGIGKYKLSYGKETYIGFNDIGEIEIKHNFNWYTLVNNEPDLEGLNNFLVARACHFDYKELDSFKEQLIKEFSKLHEHNVAVMEESPKKVKKTTPKIDKLMQQIKEMESIVKNDGFDRKVVDAAYNENIDRFKKSADMHDILVREDLDLLHNPKVGLISDKQYTELKDREGYTSRKRDIYNEIVGQVEGMLPQSKRVGSKKVSSLIRRKGSQKDIISPVYQGMLNHQEIFKKAAKQFIYNEIGKIADKYPGLFQQLRVDRIRRPDGMVMYPQDKDPNIMMAYKDGKRVPYLVNEELKRMFDHMLTPATVGWLEKIIIGSSQMFVKGTTGWYAPFALTNFFMDQITATANTSTKYTALLTPIRELYKALSGNDSVESKYLKEYFMLGGERQLFLQFGDMEPAEAYHHLKREESVIEKAIEYLNDGLDILSLPVQASEMMTRASEYIRARRMGKGQWESLELAGRVSAPFHHKGYYATPLERTMRKANSYFNSGLQGLAQNFRSFQNPKTRNRAMFVLAAVTAAGVAGMMALVQTGTETQKRLYNSIDVSDLGRYIFLPHPNGQDLLKYRIPQELTVGSTMINMAIGSAMLNANYTPFEYLKGATAMAPDQLSPTDISRMFVSWFPHIAVGPTQVLFNKTVYPSIKDLEPQYFKYLPLGERKFDSTSKLAIFLGPKIGLSPIQFDTLMIGSFGRASGMVTGKEISNPFVRKFYFTTGRQMLNFYAIEQKNKEDVYRLKNNPDDIDKKEADKIEDIQSQIKDIRSMLKEYSYTIKKDKNDESLIQMRLDILDAVDTLRN